MDETQPLSGGVGYTGFGFMHGSKIPLVLLLACLLLPVSGACPAADWPMWRYDAQRSAASPDDLPGELHLQWVRQESRRGQVWDDPLNWDLMPYDRVFEPVVADGVMFLGFNDSDKLLALDTATGEALWTFRTDGPVRLPVAAWEGKALFACDDGYLYCLNAADGGLVWKFRGGPTDRRILGNKRLISTWPARGGPVVKDGIVYFAASIWPMMGTFIYALDVSSGEVVWKNDAMGAQWINQPHNNPSFAGVAPQGAFVISGGSLLVPGGRSVPACFDLKTGEYRYYELAEYGKTGGSFVCAGPDFFFGHYREGITTMYELADGKEIAAKVGRFPVIDGPLCYTSGDTVTAFDIASIRKSPKKFADSALWTAEVDASGDLIKAGGRLYAGGAGCIAAIDPPAQGTEDSAPVGAAWTKEVDGRVERLVAANGMLFAVTLDGKIMAFGPERAEPKTVEPANEACETAHGEAREILDQTGISEGYALLYGLGDGKLLESLARDSDLHIIAFDPDAAKVDAARKRIDGLGLYGQRVAVHQGDPLAVDLPPYMASLSVVGDLAAARFENSEEYLSRLFKPMRPYGGKTWLPLDGDERDAFLAMVEQSELPQAQVVVAGGGVILSKEGPLPGAASWTHQYGNCSNTVKSDDALVKMPLGVLWFGGNPNTDVLPRHGHGPSEQIMGGRLYIEGMDCMSARDVYTGRVLWKTELGDLGTFGVYFDETYKDTPTSTAYNQVHIPGANIRGTNFVVTPDRVYVLQKENIQVLDSVIGDVVATFNPVRTKRDGRTNEWGFIGIFEDTLVAGRGFVPFSQLPTKGNLDPAAKKDYDTFEQYDCSASMELVAMDRHTGEVKWKRQADHGFLHNGIAMGDGTVFCLDKLPPFIEEFYSRRGRTSRKGYQLLALDLNTGKVKWKREEDAFGSWLGYSGEHGVLLQATRPSSDMVGGEAGKRMIVHNGKDGAPIWDIRRQYNNPPILHNDNIITHSAMYNLMTGDQIERVNPLTGNSMPWLYERTKGCGYHIASENLVTFRSSAAAYYDLTSDGGTGHFGGFKSGCSVNLIAADGVLNAPDYTRTCSCAYQNQTSLALIHTPEVEIWTTYPSLPIDGPIRRLGVNLGASGDRRAENGVLWLEYPVVGGASPEIEISSEPKESDGLDWILHHSSVMQGNGPTWVGASAAEGISSLKIGLSPGGKEEKIYTVRLYFAELRDIANGQRVFSVALQGQPVLPALDVAEEAGGPRRTLVKEFKGVKVTDALEIALAPLEDSPNRKPILCGIEVVAE